MILQKNSNFQGNVGVGAAIAYFTSLGYIVSIPLRDSQEYDLIVDNGSLKKVQVRTSTTLSESGAPTVNLRTAGGSFNGKRGCKRKKLDPSKIDLLFVLTESGSYSIPITEVNARSLLTLGYNFDKFKVHG